MCIFSRFFPSILRLAVEQLIIRIHNGSARNIISPIRMRQLTWLISCYNNTTSVLCKRLNASIRAGLDITIIFFDVGITVFQWQLIALLLLLFGLLVIAISILAMIIFRYECVI